MLRLCLIPFAASCGLVVPSVSWFRGSVGPPLIFMCFFFHFLNSEETPMAMEKSDTVMTTYWTLIRLDMSNPAEDGTHIPSRGLNGHVAEGYVVA